MLSNVGFTTDITEGSPILGRVSIFSESLKGGVYYREGFYYSIYGICLCLGVSLPQKKKIAKKPPVSVVFEYTLVPVIA